MRSHEVHQTNFAFPTCDFCLCRAKVLQPPYWHWRDKGVTHESMAFLLLCVFCSCWRNWLLSGPTISEAWLFPPQWLFKAVYLGGGGWRLSHFDILQVGNRLDGRMGQDSWKCWHGVCVLKVFVTLGGWRAGFCGFNCVTKLKHATKDCWDPAKCKKKGRMFVLSQQRACPADAWHAEQWKGTVLLWHTT